MQQRIQFNSRLGHKLVGILHLPDVDDISAYALFAHCFTCTKNINSASHIADTLSQHGIATLRFDFTGLGASGGDFADSTFSTDVNDLIDAANYLASEYDAPQLLVGHSLGGTAMLAAAAHISSAKAVASIGSPASPEHILHLIEAQLDDIESRGSAQVRLAGREFTFKQDFVDDVRSHTINYKKLGKALMVMHAPLDDTVSIEEAGQIFSQAMHPKSFVTLDSANHLLSNPDDADYAAQVLAGWAQRYITPAVNTETKQALSGVTAKAKTAQQFLCHLNANGHRLLADEPTSFGGKNAGPSPYDFLGSALASCTAMTLNMYARHKKWLVDEVSVNVEHSRIHADDCHDCEKRSGQIDVFTRTISITGKLDQEQRTRMLHIADRCPVHKTLENEIKIDSILA